MTTTERRVVSGRCPDHGIVQGIKQVPKVSFPFVVYGVRRAKAALAPARCPHCGAKLAKA
jgi:hypothetical protein